MERLEAELQAVGAVAPARRRGTFVSLLAIVWPDGHTEEFEGRVEGTLVWPPRGLRGHGYDPMFQPEGGIVTFAEMDEAQKNVCSHRARSFAAFAKSCLN